jgi:hypothetical protein
MKSFSALLMPAVLVLACASGSQINPHAGKMIIPAQGTDEFHLGMSRQEIIDLLGEPEGVQEEGLWMSYQGSHGLVFHFDNQDQISEIHFLDGFKGRLPSRIQLGSKTLDVFQAYGGPLERREVPSGSAGTEDRVLYIMPDAYRITYQRLGLAFWFSPVKRVTRMVVFQPLPDRSVRIKPMDTGQ